MRLVSNLMGSAINLMVLFSNLMGLVIKLMRLASNIMGLVIKLMRLFINLMVSGSALDPLERNLTAVGVGQTHPTSKLMALACIARASP